MNLTSRSTAPRLAALAAATAILLAACSGSAATQAPSAAPAAASGAASQVTVAQDAKLGSFLSGKDGKSLYLLTKDSANTSSCTGSCAQSWPPFELEGAETVTAGSGVTGALATITRSDDGKKQVTYNGVPLYYYAGDTKAGDVTGQGVKDVWFLAAPASTAQGGAISGGVGQGGAAASPSAVYGY